MDFKTLSRLSTLLSKVFAEDLLRLLVTHQTISASEAASRFGLHIKTAQDFFDELCRLDITEKEEVFERKRPYFRYKLKNPQIDIKFDLNSLYDRSRDEAGLDQKIRERKNAGAVFTTSKSNDAISSITVFSGEGRDRKERKISLTAAQGRFLFHLPFPTADFLTVQDIMNKSELTDDVSAEILDAVGILQEMGVLEYK
jgi:hypothetical protein